MNQKMLSILAKMHQFLIIIVVGGAMSVNASESSEESNITPFNFHPVIKAVSVKMIEQCFDEYKIEIEKSPNLKEFGILTFQYITFGKMMEASNSWPNFKRILRKVVLKYSQRNCNLIIDRCKAMVEDYVIEESYCEYGILHVYMKHQVEALTGTGELESGLNMEQLREMIKIMENLYIFGGTEQKSTTEARLVRQGSRRHDGTYLPIFDFRNVISAVSRELKAMNFMHDFEPITPEYAYQMLCQLRKHEREHSNGKKYSDMLKKLFEQPSQQSLEKRYDQAKSVMDGVLLDGYGAEKQYNLMEIMSSCQALFGDGLFYGFCEFAKKLAYFRAYYDKFDADRMIQPISGCFAPLGMDYVKKNYVNFGHTLTSMQQLYEESVEKFVQGMGFLSEKEREKALDKLKFGKLAVEVQRAVDAVSWVL